MYFKLKLAKCYPMKTRVQFQLIFLSLWYPHLISSFETIAGELFTLFWVLKIWEKKTSCFEQFDWSLSFSKWEVTSKLSNVKCGINFSKWCRSACGHLARLIDINLSYSQYKALCGRQTTAKRSANVQYGTRSSLKMSYWLRKLKSKQLITLVNDGVGGSRL